MLSRLSILLPAGGSSSRRRFKRATSRPPRGTPHPQDIEFDSESDQETLASRRSHLERERKKKKAVQVTLSDMTRTEFIQWRKTDFYAEPRDLEIDNCFWCHEQEILFNEVYLAMSEKKRVCPMKAIDFAHLMKKEDYFGTAIQIGRASCRERVYVLV